MSRLGLGLGVEGGGRREDRIRIEESIAIALAILQMRGISYIYCTRYLHVTSTPRILHQKT
jgi:hypothetical protein